MQGFVKIENAEGLVRDLSSGAVINTNRIEYENYLQKRKSSSELKQQIKQNSDKIEKLESDLSDIKQMLITLINKEK
jgi:Skp family chaperone for outer membrane proteins